ncbi:hypothetical protein MPLDJ20_120214 [Mesorhizobium plurifarium]|uniref:Uncharacterized protein n=1 Tax=Mesorhizobium plurifarium TaxID=69974 RepID=A0A090EBH4_MESPL|nr:hypothetical protein MPLDJ20_120214 [Mesorhizobium plurifarium]
MLCRSIAGQNFRFEMAGRRQMRHRSDAFQKLRLHSSTSYGSRDIEEMQAIKETLAQLHLSFLQAKVVLGTRRRIYGSDSNPRMRDTRRWQVSGRTEGVVNRTCSRQPFRPTGIPTSPAPSWRRCVSSVCSDCRATMRSSMRR